MKKIISCILALALSVSAIPFTVSAVDTNQMTSINAQAAQEKQFDMEPTTEKISYSTKEEFIKAITGGKDPAELFGENIKIDAELNCTSGESFNDYFIIYGLKSDREIANVINQLNENNDYMTLLISPVENRCGTFFTILLENVNTSNSICGLVFVDDEYPGWVSKKSIEQFSQTYKFNPSKYIINLGDTNSDFIINASDASNALALYAELSTNSNLTVTDDQLTHCDVNCDGKINASDASKILEYYAFTSVGGDCALKEFINR